MELKHDTPIMLKNSMSYEAYFNRLFAEVNHRNKTQMEGRRDTEFPLRWRHNDRDSVSNHQPHDCLLNRLFRSRSRKTSKLRVTGLCAGNSRTKGKLRGKCENVSIWWRHHVSNNYTHVSRLVLLLWLSIHLSIHILRMTSLALVPCTLYWPL